MPVTARYMAAQHIARRAGQMAHDLFVNRRLFSDATRSPAEYVAHGGRAVGALILSRLAAAFPADAFIDERRGVIAETAERLWMVEAIIGTSNFMRDIPFYAISIAYAERGRCEAAVVYDPERDEMFHARRNQGAWCEQGGRESRLEVGTCGTLRQALIAVGMDDRDPDPAALPVRRELIDAGAGARMFGAPALELAHVAAGRLDGFVGLGLDALGLMGALLLVEEAGGYASHLPAAGGIRSDLPIVGCVPTIASALNAIDGAWKAEVAVDLPLDHAFARGAHAGRGHAGRCGSC